MLGTAIAVAALTTPLVGSRGSRWRRTYTQFAFQRLATVRRNTGAHGLRAIGQTNAPAPQVCSHAALGVRDRAMGSPAPRNAALTPFSRVARQAKIHVATKPRFDRGLRCNC
jgi:hypothetical protein